jgi:hypothetical protein
MMRMSEDGYSPDYGPYNSPEFYGLEVVGSIEWTDEPYEFDTTVVWRDRATGEFLYANDSGCSCPCPFEDHKREDLTPTGSLAEFRATLDARNVVSSFYPDRTSEVVVLAERLHALGLR